MIVSGLIRKRFGSYFPVDLNEEALRLYSQVQGLDPSFADEAKRCGFDYDACNALHRAVKTADEWRKLAWCFTAVAYRHVVDENLSVGEIGMGVLKNPYQTSLFRFKDRYEHLFSLSANHGVFQASKGFVTYEESIRAPYNVDYSKWQECVSEVLRIIVETPEKDVLAVPRFDPAEMIKTEGGYLSFFYRFSFGRYVFVFHTTECGFDLFSTIRRLLGEMPQCVRRFLGERAITANL